MRTPVAISFTAPAAYARLIESDLAVLLADIGRDTKRVADGAQASAWGDMVDRTQTGRVMISIVAIPSDEQQKVDEHWPDEPPAGERFAGYPEPERKSA